jgi:Asp-tRNA(Asn)/Glu-tRNA(Gln) amidotransferase A subunit family amidase
MLMQAMAEKMKGIDVFVAPSYGGSTLLLTNLTGHPAVVVPAGENKEGRSMSISFIGNLFEEGKTLTVARAFQEATDFHLMYPDLEKQKGSGADE